MTALRSPAVTDAATELRRLQDRRRAVLAFAIALGVEVRGSPGK